MAFQPASGGSRLADFDFRLPALPVKREQIDSLNELGFVERREECRLLSARPAVGRRPWLHGAARASLDRPLTDQYRWGCKTPSPRSNAVGAGWEEKGAVALPLWLHADIGYRHNSARTFSASIDGEVHAGLLPTRTTELFAHFGIRW